MSISRIAFEKRFERLKGKNCSVPWTSHELRHAWISKMIEAGVDKARVMQWAGQKSSQATDIYTHVIHRDIEQFRNRIVMGESFVQQPAEIIPMKKSWAPNGHQNLDENKNASSNEELPLAKCSGTRIRT